MNHRTELNWQNVLRRHEIHLSMIQVEPHRIRELAEQQHGVVVRDVGFVFDRLKQARKHHQFSLEYVKRKAWDDRQGDMDIALRNMWNRELESGSDPLSWPAHGGRGPVRQQFVEKLLSKKVGGKLAGVVARALGGFPTEAAPRGGAGARGYGTTGYGGGDSIVNSSTSTRTVLGNVVKKFYRKLRLEKFEDLIQLWTVQQRGGAGVIRTSTGAGRAVVVAPSPGQQGRSPSLPLTADVAQARATLFRSLERNWQQRRSCSSGDNDPFAGHRQFNECVRKEEDADVGTRALLLGGNTALFPYTKDLHNRRMCTANLRIDLLDEVLMDASSAFQLSKELLGLCPWGNMLAKHGSQNAESVLGSELADFRGDPMSFLAQLTVYMERFDAPQQRVTTIDPFPVPVAGERDEITKTYEARNSLPRVNLQALQALFLRDLELSIIWGYLNGTISLGGSSFMDDVLSELLVGGGGGGGGAGGAPLSMAILAGDQLERWMDAVRGFAAKAKTIAAVSKENMIAKMMGKVKLEIVEGVVESTKKTVEGWADGENRLAEIRTAVEKVSEKSRPVAQQYKS